jgi:DNA-binding MurR/RpiR family transcriptional regulator
VGTLAEVARRDNANLQRLLSEVDEALLGAAVRRITGARHRLLLGRGVSQVMSEMLAYQLTQAGFACIMMGPAEFATQVANLGSKDLLIVFSFTPYSRETVDAAAFAKECGIPVLAFSDHVGAPLGAYAEHLLPVACENLLYSHSLTSFAVLSHALATAAAALDRGGTIKRLKAADNVARPLFVAERGEKP